MMLQVAAARVERWRDLIARCGTGSVAAPSTDSLFDFEVELLRLLERRTPAAVLRDRLAEALDELEEAQIELEDTRARLEAEQAENTTLRRRKGATR